MIGGKLRDAIISMKFFIMILIVLMAYILFIYDIYFMLKKYKDPANVYYSSKILSPNGHGQPLLEKSTPKFKCKCKCEKTKSGKAITKYHYM